MTKITKSHICEDRAGRAKKKKLMEKVLRLYSVKPGKRDVNDFYYEYPVEDKTVLLSGLGRNVNGSLRFILNELNYNDDYKDFRIYVRTTYENTDAEVNEAIKKNGWNRTETVPKGFNRKLETCKYLLTESWFPYQFIKRPEQVMIDIWHGTPLKSLGLLRSGSKCHLSKMEQKSFLSSDYLTYPNEYTRNKLLDSYKVAPLLTAESVMMGYPRTAGMMSVTDARREEIRSMLAPEADRIYAYMPTFREYLSDEESVRREQTFLDHMDHELTDSEVMYVNLHHFHHRGKGLDYEGFRHIRRFPEELDTYELLAATDALISDYSSVFLDYLILKRKVILYVEDYEQYDANQGLGMEINKLPVDVAVSADEVVSFLRDGIIKDTTGISDLYRYDRKENTEDLCRLFLGDESRLDILPHDEKKCDKNVLFYSAGFESERDTDILFSAVKKQKADDINVYVCCDEKKTDLNQDRAYPELHDMNVIASDADQPLSSVGKAVWDLYSRGRMPYRLAMSYLKYDLAVMGTRMFGNAHFSMLCIYDTTDPEMIAGLALSDAADTKVLYISAGMTEALKKHDRMLRDALVFAIPYCDLVVTADSGDVPYLSRILHDKVISCDGDLSRLLSLVR